MTTEHLVLPITCCEAVMTLTNIIARVGELGEKKRSDRILHRFYWPSLYCDVAKHCKSVKSCRQDKHQGHF